MSAFFAAVLLVLCCSAIRSISCFDDLRMMVLADSAGMLAVTDAPSATNGAASAAVVPGHIPGAPTHTRWTPQQGVAKIKAHKSSIIAVASAVRSTLCLLPAGLGSALDS